MKKGALLVVLALLFGCSSEQGSESNTYVLSDDSLALMLVEVHFRNAVIQHKHIKGKPAEALAWDDYERVFDSLGVSRERFDSSLHYYLGISGAMEPIYDMALSALSTRLAEAGHTREDSGASQVSSKEELEALMKNHPSLMTPRHLGKARAKQGGPSPAGSEQPSVKQPPKPG
jgi:hypothetical protein